MNDYTITFWAKRKGAWFGQYLTATIYNRPNLARACGDLIENTELIGLRGFRLISYTESPVPKPG